MTEDIELAIGEAMLIIGVDGKPKGAVMPRQGDSDVAHPASRTVARILTFLDIPEIVAIVDAHLNITAQKLREAEAKFAEKPEGQVRH